MVQNLYSLVDKLFAITLILQYVQHRRQPIHYCQSLIFSIPNNPLFIVIFNGLLFVVYFRELYWFRKIWELYSFLRIQGILVWCNFLALNISLSFSLQINNSMLDYLLRRSPFVCQSYLKRCLIRIIYCSTAVTARQSLILICLYII